MPGLIEKSGATPSERSRLFYGVCIPLRLSLALFVYWKSTSPIVQGILLATSAISVYVNLLGLNTSNEVWWSRGFHTLTSLAIFLSLLGGFRSWVPGIMILDVLFGLLTSFSRDPWNVKF